MYFVKYGEEFLHDPRITTEILSEGIVNLEENSCGYFDFTVTPDNPLYSKLTKLDHDNPIQVFDQDKLLFSGYIYDTQEQFYGEREVKCKGELEYLNDSVIRPYSTDWRSFGAIAPWETDLYFAWLVQQHNAQVSSNKQFLVGINQGRELDPETYKPLQNDEYPNTMAEVSQKILVERGGYIRCRREGKQLYLDLISKWTNLNSQKIEFGVNLKDLFKENSADPLYTYAVPIGAMLNETEYPFNDGYFLSNDEAMVPGKEYYVIPWQSCPKMREFDPTQVYFEEFESEPWVTEDPEPIPGITYYVMTEQGNLSRVDISRFVDGETYYEQEKVYFETEDIEPTDEKTYYIMSLNFSKVENQGRFKAYETYYEYDPGMDESQQYLDIWGAYGADTGVEGISCKEDMVYSPTAVLKYGWRGTTYRNEEIKTKEELRWMAAKYLQTVCNEKTTIDIKAVDMHLLNPDLKPITIGDYVHVSSKPHNLDDFYICRKMSIDLINPGESVYTFGQVADTLTTSQNEVLRKLRDTVNKAQTMIKS